jgi:hypothetical protein
MPIIAVIALLDLAISYISELSGDRIHEHTHFCGQPPNRKTSA